MLLFTALLDFLVKLHLITPFMAVVRDIAN